MYIIYIYSGGQEGVESTLNVKSVTNISKVYRNSCYHLYIMYTNVSVNQRCEGQRSSCRYSSDHGSRHLSGLCRLPVSNPNWEPHSQLLTT